MLQGIENWKLPIREDCYVYLQEIIGILQGADVSPKLLLSFFFFTFKLMCKRYLIYDY